MDIETFESAVNALLKKDDETGLFTDTLEMRVLEDGCLGALFNNEVIPCEGMPWSESLRVIIAFIHGRKRINGKDT